MRSPGYVPEAKKTFKVAIVDDHRFFLESFSTLLKKINTIDVIGFYLDGQELINDPQLNELDIVFTDLRMQGINGYGVIDHIKKEHPHIKIVVVSSFIDTYIIHEVIERGAVGYVTKGTSVLKIHEVFSSMDQGKVYISPDVEKDYQQFLEIRNKRISDMNALGLVSRDLEIIKLLADGKKAREIGEVLHLSKKTIEAEKKKIADKLGVKRTSEIVAKAYQNKLLE